MLWNLLVLIGLTVGVVPALEYRVRGPIPRWKWPLLAILTGLYAAEGLLGLFGAIMWQWEAYGYVAEAALIAWVLCKSQPPRKRKPSRVAGAVRVLAHRLVVTPV